MNYYHTILCAGLCLLALCFGSAKFDGGSRGYTTKNANHTRERTGEKRS